MKNFKILILLAVILTSVSGCYRVKVDGGEESVLVAKPFFGSQGGVLNEPVTAGAEWCALTTDHYEFVVTPVTYTEAFPNMMPSDNTPISFDVYLKLKIKTKKTPQIYEHFGVNWYKNNVSAPFRTMVRDKSNPYTMFQLTSDRNVLSKIEKELFEGTNKLLDSIVYDGTKLRDLVEVQTVSVGAVSPPEQVLTETKNTAAQNQNKLTQAARAGAEDARKDAEIKKARADKAYQNEMGMTIGEYQHQRQLEIEKEKVELIKDNKNITIIFGSNLPVTYPATGGK